MGGYNKMVEEWKASQQNTKEKMKFILKTLTDKDAAMTMQANNALKQRCQMLNGVGMGDAGMKKVQLIKRLTNQGFNLQTMAYNKFIEFLRDAREQERLAEEERLRQQKEKDRILRRVCDVNIRIQGAAYRQLYQHMEAEVEKERNLMMRQRGIMRKIVDSNTRYMGMGYNKLVESWKASQNAAKEKLKFIIKSLTDKDAQFTLQAYNAMKQRCNMQTMAMNKFVEYLKFAREEERLAEEERLRQ